MRLLGWIAIALVAGAVGCRSSQAPSVEVVKQSAEMLFNRAAKGGDVPVNIPFTGEGQATPKLLRTEVNPLTPGTTEDGAQLFHYDVRLTYMNRIQQMENASFRFGFVKTKEGVWMPWFPAQK
jgi:hypothetical protein